MNDIVNLIAAQADVRIQHQLILSALNRIRNEKPAKDELSGHLYGLAAGSEYYSSVENRIAALLSAVLYEWIPRGEGLPYAKQCMDMVEGYRKRKGLTYSETIYQKMGAKGLSVAKGIPQMLLPQNPDTYKKYTGRTHLLVLSDEEELFAYREETGTIVLAMFLHQTEPFIACDFEMNEYSDEVPLCFTQTSHYSSPMYRLKELREVLEALFIKYDYPRIPIKLQAVYTDERAIVENPEDNERFWKDEGMEYAYPSSLPEGIIQGVSLPVYPHALLAVMKEAKETLKELPVDTVYSAEQIEAFIGLM